MAQRDESDIADALIQTLISPNEADRNWEAANVVDGLYFIGRAIHALAKSVDRLSANGAGAMSSNEPGRDAPRENE